MCDIGQNTVLMIKMLKQKFMIILSSFLLMPTVALAGDYVYEAGRGLAFSWAKDDMVGIAEPVTNEQLCFWTSSTTMAQNGERPLYATGFNLKSNTEYCSYYPYAWRSNFNTKSVTFSYLGQYEEMNRSLTHLYDYDFSIAKSKSSSTDCTFTYKRIGCVLRIQATMPQGLRIVELQVKTRSNSIPVKATADLTKESVAWSDFQSSLSLKHTEIPLVKGSSYIAYVAFPAVDLTSEQLTFTIVGKDNTTITFATIEGINFQAGKLYDLNLSATTPVTANPFTPTTASKSQSLSRPVAHVDNIPLATGYTIKKISALRGDINNDGRVSLLDLVLLIRHLNDNTATNLDPNVADIDGNGTINSSDAKALSSLLHQVK